MGVAVVVNGESVDLAGEGPITLEEFVQQQALRADRVAVERNGEIVSRQQWTATVLCPGDRLEVVHFVGGGVPTS